MAGYHRQLNRFNSKIPIEENIKLKASWGNSATFFWCLGGKKYQCGHARVFVFVNFGRRVFKGIIQMCLLRFAAAC